MRLTREHWVRRSGAASLLMVLTGVYCPLTSAEATGVKYSKVRISLHSREDVRSLQQVGLYFDHIRFNRDSFDVVMSEHELELLRHTGRSYEILIDDMAADYRQRATLPAAKRAVLEQTIQEEYPVRGLRLGSMGGMYTFDEVVAALDSMQLLYPHLISTKQSIGQSYEGRPIWMVKISDFPDLDEAEPEILYTALHHANEPMSLMVVLYFMYYLLEQYGQDQEVTSLVDDRELYFVPVVNPDGYVYGEELDPEGGRGWRGNRNLSVSQYGVDLNRNYGFGWAGEGIGSRGDAPFSEPETQAMRDFCIGREFKLALNYHDFIEGLLLHPWGYNSSIVHTPDSTTYRELGAKMTALNGYPHGPVVELIYEAPGYHDDWMYGEQEVKGKILAMTPEVGAGFWPRPDSIFVFAHRMLHMNLVMAQGPGVIHPGISSGIERSESNILPKAFTLFQSYPNPFNAGTTIKYQLARASDVQLAIYNLKGQKEATLVGGRREPGTYTLLWDGRDDGGRLLASGVYLCRLASATQAEALKLLLLR